MSEPALGILVDRPAPEAFGDLLTVLRRWCRPAAWSDGMPAPAAWITTSPAVTPPTDAPRAVWIEADDELRDPGAASAAVLLCADRQLLAHSRRAVAVTGTIDAIDAPALTPFVRARYRRARGISAEFIIGTDDEVVTVLPHGRAIQAELRGTALAMASAAVVHGRALVTALAWGTPCVTDAASAAAIGAADDVQVVIESGDPYAAAVRLARDERKAAALSRAGRRLVETELDRVAPARRVAVALGLHGRSPYARFDAALDCLNTPPAARIRARARAAMLT